MKWAQLRIRLWIASLISWLEKINVYLKLNSVSLDWHSLQCTYIMWKQNEGWCYALGTTSKFPFWILHHFFFLLLLLFSPVDAKPSLKIGSVNKAFLFWYWQWLTIFLRNKTFLFFKTGSWNFQNLFEKEFRETSQNVNSIRQPIEKNVHNSCLNKLNELKFCEVTQNFISNIC